jgi:ABC-type sulfate/molybdate transport systems ATPase subunit|nr:hypothetical protein [Geoalkalibacter subterraneus]
MDEALKLGDRIIIMKDGAIVQNGTPEDILTNPPLRVAFSVFSVIYSYLFASRGRHSYVKGVWRQGGRQSNGQGWRKVSLVMGVATPRGE